MLLHVVVARESATGRIVDAEMKYRPEVLEKGTVQQLSRKWLPVKYHIESVITENPSLYFSSDEMRTIERLAQGKRPVPPEESREIIATNKTSVKWGKTLLLVCIRTFMAQVAMIAGEANPIVYDNEVYEVLKETYGKTGLLPEDKKTLFITGPILAVEDKFANDKVSGSIVPLLQEEPNCVVYYSRRRQPIHIRIGGNKAFYIETSHEPLAKHRYSWHIQDDEEQAQRFLEMIRFLISSDEVTVSKSPADFIFLTRTELTELKKAMGEETKQGLVGSWDECVKDDYLRIIEKYQIAASS